MFIKKLNFKLKGDRKYIHGSDIFNQSLQEILILYNDRDYSNLRLNIKKRVLHESELVVFVDTEENHINQIDDASVTFSLNLRSKKIFSYIRENNVLIDNSYKYDEESISSSIQILDDKVVLLYSNNFSNIENIIAMNKALVNSKINVDRGKWFFSSLNLKESINDIEIQKIQIQLTKILANKHSKSTILYENNLIGNIFFSLN